MDSRERNRPIRTGVESHVVSNDDEGHVISQEEDHMVQSDENWHGNTRESEEDTAGEGMDTPPLDSVTTDGYTDHMDPIDFIETHPRDCGRNRQRLGGPHPQGYTHSFEEDVGVGQGVIREAQYEKWSMLMQMEDSNKKGDHYIPLCVSLTFLPLHFDSTTYLQYFCCILSFYVSPFATALPPSSCSLLSLFSSFSPFPPSLPSPPPS